MVLTFIMILKPVLHQNEPMDDSSKDGRFRSMQCRMKREQLLFNSTTNLNIMWSVSNQYWTQMFSHTIPLSTLSKAQNDDDLPAISRSRLTNAVKEEMQFPMKWSAFPRIAKSIWGLSGFKWRTVTYNENFLVHHLSFQCMEKREIFRKIGYLGLENLELGDIHRLEHIGLGYIGLG